ncbi:kelch domain-containing protein 2-like isoform X2 [Neocloeon triangulifer]|uniref:kelch domain-containing protein 2-like isoform X2 n=1 Tax=Neocloeon triangulifer TaxID=2078957 RepID=UPI00286F73D6|nr:kelch domain-containing protein 2-like isoform X2 [Neocloeon triangulifer]
MQFADIVPQGPETEHFHKRIHCRSGHISVKYRNYVLVWGGSREVHYDMETKHEYHDTGEVMMYNCCTEVWTRLITSGQIPLKCSGSTGVILGECLYVFGGTILRLQQVFNDGEGTSFETSSNALYKLDMRTLVWTELHPSGVCPSPCDKLVSWEYAGKLYFFGGFGPNPQNLANVPFMYIESSEDYAHKGWNNQFLCYNPEENNWSWPASKGPTPLPRAAHAADIKNGKVYIFGGRLLDERVNTLYCIDMETMRWTENLTNLSDECPEGRSWHSFSFINDTTAIIYGGFSKNNMILSDCWQLNVETLTWTRIETNRRDEPRLWHNSVYFSSPGREGELFMIGGYKTSVYHNGPRQLADALLTLNFEPKSLYRLCIKSCLKNFKETSSQWKLLPKTVEKTLKQRLEQINY